MMNLEKKKHQKVKSPMMQVLRYGVQRRMQNPVEMVKE